IVKDVRPGDDGVYSCRAENLLGEVNASAKLNVQFPPQLLFSSNGLMAEEKQNVTIACTATAQPLPRITWSKSVGSLPENRTEVLNGTMTIHSVTRKDGGTYICKAENILGSATDTAQLVIFPPLKFKVRPPLEVTPSAFGSSVHLPCVAESDLRTTIAWAKDGKFSLPVESNVLQNGTLLIRNIKKSHEGSYTCRATNALTTIEAKVKVNSPVITPSSCSLIRKYVSSASGNYAIDSDAAGGLTPFTVYCDMSDKNGVGVTVISHDSESRTYVNGNGYTGRGSYSRDIHYTGASFSKLASLTRVSSHCEQFIKYECYGSVMLTSYGVYAWWVSRDSSQMTYWGGASPGSGKCACGMTNSCAYPSYGCNSDGNPRPKVTWSKLNSSLPVGRHVLESSGALIVKDVRPGDDGVYSCIAENLLGQVNASAKLTVQFPPHLSLSSNRLMAEENQNVSIACTVTGRPFPHITWSKSVGRLPEDRNEVINGTLKIYSVTRNEGGIYICKAENILGSVTDGALLMIFSPLKFQVRPPLEVTASAFGSSVYLPCVAESDLRTTIAWTKDDKSSLPVESNVLQNGTLLIRNFKKSHEGSYTCRATNALTTIEAKVKTNSPATATSCSVIGKHVSSASGNYVIDPDGAGGLAPFTVYCDMSDKNGVVRTIKRPAEYYWISHVSACHKICKYM
ncbi:Down syndrome cell adhesion molecule-like protein 1, partial [Orbicella faveolata]|uniref:Down syndrome cell adhesion molecule-like protein 1 n=1 Tax=Orbicella faveolata TaxID=48498 RepID=UPI0009E427A3